MRSRQWAMYWVHVLLVSLICVKALSFVPRPKDLILHQCNMNLYRPLRGGSGLFVLDGERGVFSRLRPFDKPPWLGSSKITNGLVKVLVYLATL